MPDVKIGDHYGRWQVLTPGKEKVFPTKTVPTWACRCECGVERTVTQVTLKSGASKSCGCLNREATSRANNRYGEASKYPEYAVWGAMIDRCRNPRNPRYPHYGGRGVVVCERWKSYLNFLADMGRRPGAEFSIDRIDNDGIYSAGNCRWALASEQMSNRTVTRFVEVDGVQIPLVSLAKKYGIPANTLRFRILKGWNLSEAFTTPVRKKAKSKA